MGLKKKKNTIYTHTLNNKLTVFSQLLDELQQNIVIQAECEEDLRYTLLNRYPVRLIEMPDTMVELIRKATELLPEIKRIIETQINTYILP